jgi:FkbM family methyltransferase
MGLWDVIYDLPKIIPPSINKYLRPLQPIYQDVKELSYRLRPAQVVETEWGPKLHIEFTNPIERQIVHSNYEPQVVDFFLHQVCTGNKYFADVGANIGFYSLLFSHNNPDGRVDAFDPVPEALVKIYQNAKINEDSDININACAIGNEQGVSEIFVNSGHIGESSLSEELYATDKTHSYVVAMRTLDGIYNTGQEAPPDVIKIDVEGAELDVLQGGQRMLRNHTPELLLEIHPPMFTDAAATIEQIVTLLESAGYSNLYHIEGKKDISFDRLAEFEDTGSTHVYVT